jgi:ABC-type polysaccharide/polyol phosphate export permease
MLAYIKELWSTRELLANLTMRDVKGMYRRTILGQLWSLLNPLGTMLVYTIVFSFLFKAAPEPGNPSGLNIYALWLMCGLLPWTFFVRVVSGSMTSLVDNANLIKKVYFPRMQLPFAVVGSTGFTWLNEMGLIIIVVLICGGWVIPWVPFLLVLMVLLALYSSGIGMLLAVLNTYFRDTEHFIAIGLRMMMYLAPVLYPLSLVVSVSKDHPWIIFLYELNPMEHFLEVFRNLLYDNRWPTSVDWIWCFSCAVGVFVIGFYVFMRNERRLAVLL